PTLGISAAAVVGTAALALLVFHVTRPEYGVPAADGVGAGITVRQEAAAIFVPAEFSGIAATLESTHTHLSPEAQRSDLQSRGLDNTWYAITYRFFQANGRVATVTTHRRVSDAALNVQELHAVLATVAGRPPHDCANTDFSSAKVWIIPKE